MTIETHQSGNGKPERSGTKTPASTAHACGFAANSPKCCESGGGLICRSAGEGACPVGFNQMSESGSQELRNPRNRAAPRAFLSLPIVQRSDSDLLQCALIKLIEDHRPVVAHALIKGFGSEMKLLEAMEASIGQGRGRSRGRRTSYGD